jgi:hypothetical protein
MDRFIVAEITKNWTPSTPAVDLLSQRFETVINVNLERGYKLVDWKISTVTDGTVVIETIIAIFEKEMPQLNPKPS